MIFTIFSIIKQTALHSMQRLRFRPRDHSESAIAAAADDPSLDDEDVDESTLLNVIDDLEENDAVEEAAVPSGSPIGRRPDEAANVDQSEAAVRSAVQSDAAVRSAVQSEAAVRSAVQSEASHNRLSFAPEAGRGAPLAELALGIG